MTIMELPKSIFFELFKSQVERENKSNLLYKCKTYDGFGCFTNPNLSSGSSFFIGMVRVYDCETCYGLGSLYFFELIKYSKYFDQEDFYL